MPINSKKANEIDAYINSHPSCKRSEQPVEINGELKFLLSYMLPLYSDDGKYFLQYNHDNRRFNLEIQEYERAEGKVLNPAEKDDAKKIKELLLQDEIEAEKLYDDLKQLGQQREVAAVTYDGIVINGNRRMATIEELHKENPKKWNELWVVRLPKDISEKDLWKIEAGLQLSKQKVADYGPINNLLMIFEGKKAGLSPDEIAASMYGWSDKQVIFDLDRLNLIDTFLLFFGQPNNYGIIKRFRLNEHFIDLQKYLVEKMKNLGAPKKQITKKLEIAFLYLKTAITKPDVFSFTHYDMRNLCKILLDEEATYTLTDSFEKYRKDIKQIPAEKLSDNFDKAIDVKKDREDKDKPVKLIERAIAALNSIDRRGKHYKKDDVRAKIKTLDALVREMKKELGMN
jgi:hypothetical protein